jgi:hypothetical protein
VKVLMMKHEPMSDSTDIVRVHTSMARSCWCVNGAMAYVDRVYLRVDVAGDDDSSVVVYEARIGLVAGQESDHATTSRARRTVNLSCGDIDVKR